MDYYVGGVGGYVPTILSSIVQNWSHSSLFPWSDFKGASGYMLLGYRVLESRSPTFI